MSGSRTAAGPHGKELVDCIELPVIVVDGDLALVSFNPAAAALLSLNPSDRGRKLHSIETFTRLHDLAELCEHVVSSGSSHRVEVADRDGSWFSINVSCYKTGDQDIDGAVITFSNVTAFRESLDRAIEEREYTKAVINTIADALVIVDEELRVQAANQAFYKLFQTSREASQGSQLHNLGSRDWDIACLRTLLAETSPANGDLGTLECDLEFSGVGRRTLLLKARRLTQRSRAGQLVLIAIQDITERKRTERALRESEQRFRVITDAAPILVWMSGTDKLCYYFNKGWLNFVGRTLDQEAGNGWAENVHPDDFDRCLQIYVTSFDAQQPFEMEYRLKHHSGQYRWILDHGVPRYSPDGTFEGYVGGCLDIHERKEAAEQLRTALVASRRLAAIVESSDDAVISKDLDGIVTSWNPAAERIYGYTAQEMIGRSIRTVIPPELQDDEQRILATIARGERIEHFETVRITKSGERIDVSLTISPVKDDSGRTVGAAKIARDITERKKAERALRTSERLASVGRLAATVAHEINNPLEAVTNLVYLAKDRAARDDVREFLSVAEEELERISHLTKQTLGFYRDTRGPSAMKIGTILHSLISVFAARIRNKGIEIYPEILDDPEIYAVPGEIRQLIANLLNNSIDAVEPGARIRVRISAAVAHRGKPSRGLRITVADSGPGIPAEVRERLFEPFFTTKKDVGTGLGLWVCKSIVEKHHGAIRVKSSTAPGRSWTAFSVFLPSLQQSAGDKDVLQQAV
ncbi:MAG: PAS domain-containing sensor histidine kinase [Terriglobales bacterium]